MLGLGSHMKGAGMLSGRFELHPWPIWAWPNHFCPLKEIILKHSTATFTDSKDIIIEYFSPYIVLTLKETITAKYNGILPKTP